MGKRIEATEEIDEKLDKLHGRYSVLIDAREYWGKVLSQVEKNLGS